MFLLKILFSIYLFGCILALGYNYWIIKKGASGIEWKQCFNPIKHVSVLIGFTFSLIPLHIIEQVVIRLYDPYCRVNCLLTEKGRCDKCLCKTRAKMMSPFEQCSRDRWGPMILSKKKYKKHREQFPVRIELKYGDN